MKLEVKNLSFSYGRRRVLDDVSFTAESGTLMAVLGANGAGKSTLFRCILGFLSGGSGETLLDGTDIRGLTRRQLASRIAYIPQSSVPIYNYTVLDTVLMGTAGTLEPLRSPGEVQRDRAQKALEQLGITHLADRGVREISGGERQLALIARALAQNAELLLMDEPTANLDYGNQYRVLSRVEALVRRGYTVLLSTHNPAHAFEFATDVLALSDGRLLTLGKTKDVLTCGLIERLYGIEVQLQDIDTEAGPVRSCVPVSIHGGSL